MQSSIKRSASASPLVMLNMLTQKIISGSAVVRFSENGDCHVRAIADEVHTLVRLPTFVSIPAVIMLHAQSPHLCNGF